MPIKYQKSYGLVLWTQSVCSEVGFVAIQIQPQRPIPELENSNQQLITKLVHHILLLIRLETTRIRQLLEIKNSVTPGSVQKADSPSLL